jgi:hypothetical protein
MGGIAGSSSSQEDTMTRILALSAVLLLAGAATIGAADKTKTASGKVTAVSGDSLSIMSGSQTMTFAVDATTKVLGKGLGTLANEKKTKGEAFVITDGVANDDVVRVDYHDMGGGKLHAAAVHVVQKNLKSQVQPK